MFENLPDILTFEEARSALRVGKNTMLQLLWDGQIDGFRIGRCWRIPRSALINYIRHHQVF